MIYLIIGLFLSGFLSSFVSFVESFAVFQNHSPKLLSLITAISGSNWMMALWLVIIGGRVELIAPFTAGIFIGSLCCHKLKNAQKMKYV